MKKRYLLALLTLLGFTLPAHSYMETFGQYDSSYTATNETTVRIPNTWPGTVLIGVAVSTGDGMVTIYDSSAAAQNIVGRVRLTSTGGIGSFCVPFEVKLSSALTYTTTGNTGGVTFIFKRLR